RIDVAVAAERAEGGDRVGRFAGDVDRDAVGAHGDGGDAGEAVDGAYPVVLRLDERERAAVGVTVEHADGAAVGSRGVDVRPVRAHGEGLDAVQAVDAVDRLALELDEGQHAGRRVTAEDGDGVVQLAGHVDVRVVGADGERCGAQETV